MSRRTLLVIIGSFILIGLFLLVLVLWPGEEPSSPTTQNGEDFFPVTQTESRPGDFFGIGDDSAGTGNGAFSGFGDDEKILYTKITNDPVVAPKAVGTEEELDLRLRYVLRETGHVYEYDPRTNTGTRISNTTMPHVFHALWSEDASRLILRAFDGTENVVRTFASRVATTTDRSTLRGEFLPDSITDLAISPSGKNIFYLLNTNGRANGYVYDFDKETTIKSFSPPSSEWLVSWLKETTLLFTSKGSSGATGFSYTVDLISTTPTLKKVLGGYAGLTLLPDSTLTQFVFGQTLSGRVGQSAASVLLHTSLWSNGEVREFPVNTLPEKCVWGKRTTNIVYCAAPNEIPEGAYPDNWYLGTVSFSDTLWKIDTTTGTARALFNPEITAGEKIDAINLTLDNTEHYLFFINKRDDSLWSLRLDNPSL